MWAMGAPLSMTGNVALENRSDDGVDSLQSLGPDGHRGDERHDGNQRSGIAEEGTHGAYSLTRAVTMFLFCSPVNGYPGRVGVVRQFEFSSPFARRMIGSVSTNRSERTIPTVPDLYFRK